MYVNSSVPFFLCKRCLILLVMLLAIALLYNVVLSSNFTETFLVPVNHLKVCHSA